MGDEFLLRVGLVFGIPPSVAIAITIFLMRRSISKGGHASALHAIIASFLTPLFLFLCLSLYFDGFQIFTDDYWHNGAKATRIELFPPFLGLLVIYCLIPTAFVVFLYQRRLKQCSR